ncbi:SCO2521 family protein [Natronoglycomyces albus]|uniref:Uncharacterized protein n=1 Tax=Natronoglycomyces albus TaxID=2811108 RepID=A0A895XR55_9ACTN|nr:SCO2521 family protein [Natronoglycomyces albus]QSB06003.1 hypothetical protein JQS30_03505 [Natronoglycomyces albus]
MITIGEIHSGLLHHSHGVTTDQASQLLTLVAGERARQWKRPIQHACSPTLLTGVDCLVPLAPKNEDLHARRANGHNGSVRVIGTMNSRATITGGHLLQGSTYGSIKIGTKARRMPWSYYLSQPGKVESISQSDPQRLIGGLLRAQQGPKHLDTTALATHIFHEVQAHSLLDRESPLRTARTKLRWIAIPKRYAPEAAPVSLTLDSPTDRLLYFVTDEPDSLALAHAAEDVAVHDWLLTTLLAELERAPFTNRNPEETLRMLQPVVDHLMHLWMPKARVNESLWFVWEALDKVPGFTRQWETLTRQIEGRVNSSATALTRELLSMQSRGYSTSADVGRLRY